MKSRTIIHFAIFSLLNFTFLACEKDVSSNNNNSGGHDSSDNTISEQIKEVILSHGSLYSLENNTYEKCVFYESYTYRYSFCFVNGNIGIYVEHRANGSFVQTLQNDPDRVGIIDAGVFSSITDIPSFNTNIIGEGTDYRYDAMNGYPHWKYYASQFYPQHGYNAAYITEDSQIVQFRIYAKKYETDEGGNLKTATIQYQLVAPETFGDESVLNGTSWVATTPQFGYPANVDWRMVFTTANSGVLKIHYGWGGNDSSFPFSYAYSKDIGGKMLVAGSRPIWSFVLEDESLLLSVPGNNNVISVGGSDGDGNGGGVVTFYKQ